jgi:hypothetical protein
MGGVNTALTLIVLGKISADAGSLPPNGRELRETMATRFGRL